MQNFQGFTDDLTPKDIHHVLLLLLTCQPRSCSHNLALYVVRQQVFDKRGEEQFSEQSACNSESSGDRGEEETEGRWGSERSLVRYVYYSASSVNAIGMALVPETNLSVYISLALLCVPEHCESSRSVVHVVQVLRPSYMQ